MIGQIVGDGHERIAFGADGHAGFQLEFTRFEVGLYGNRNHAHGLRGILAARGKEHSGGESGCR